MNEAPQRTLDSLSSAEQKDIWNYLNTYDNTDFVMLAQHVSVQHNIKITGKELALFFFNFLLQ